MSEKSYGVIQEQGDLGLGWSPVSEDEQALMEQTEQQTENNKNSGAR